MATLLKHWRKQAKLRWLLPAIWLALACASSVHGQAVTRALPLPQVVDTVYIELPPDTFYITTPPETSYVDVPGGVTVYQRGKIVIKQDTVSVPVIILREEPPPVPWPWWIVVVLVLLLILETYMLWPMSKTYRLVKEMPASPPPTSEPDSTPEQKLALGYVGNANTKEIHNLSRIKKGCQFSRMLPKNRVYFASLEEVDRAIKEQGYNGCRSCMPDRDTG